MDDFCDALTSGMQSELCEAIPDAEVVIDTVPGITHYGDPVFGIVRVQCICGSVPASLFLCNQCFAVIVYFGGPIFDYCHFEYAAESSIDDIVTLMRSQWDYHRSLCISENPKSKIDAV